MSILKAIFNYQNLAVLIVGILLSVSVIGAYRTYAVHKYTSFLSENGCIADVGAVPIDGHPGNLVYSKVYVCFDGSVIPIPRIF